MDKRIPWIQSKRHMKRTKNSRLCFKMFIISICIFAASFPLIRAITCPSSVSNSSATIVEQCSFQAYDSASIEWVASGLVSNSLFYLYKLSAASNDAAVRKVDSSGVQKWMASFQQWPSMKSLSVDASEQQVYLSTYSLQIIILILSASNGGIVAQHS